MKHSKSALVLMELIIVILFFSLASTVCIQLFSKSHLLSQQTVNENHAVIYAQNLAECFLATEGDLLQLQSLFPCSSEDTSADSVVLLFDEHWNPCTQDNARYSASLTSHTQETGLIRADITISAYPSASTDSIYTLTVMHHIPERRGTHDE